MSKHFISVLKLVDASSSNEKSSGGETRGEFLVPLEASSDGTTLILPAEQPHPRKPPSASSKNSSLCFDKILLPEISGSALYDKTAKEVVDSTLLGYHGTIITLSPSETQEEKMNSLSVISNGLIQKATNQMFRCLKKSRKSRSKISAKLIILCSYMIIIEEDVRDLLFDFSLAGQSQVVPAIDSSEVHLPPKLTVMDGRALKISQHHITSSSKVGGMLTYGREREREILSTYDRNSHAIQNHHTIFTLTVEFSQFGSMNAPISGNLSFVNIASSDPLSQRQRFMQGDVIDKSVNSLFWFADVVESLTSHMAALDGIRSSESAFKMERDAAYLLPCVPSQENPRKLCEKSILTQLIGESLGGNCKTLMITFSPDHVTASSCERLFETLKLASRAQVIQNTPNKRDLAEKALMSAYMRGLEEAYGRGIQAKEENPKLTTTDNKEGRRGRLLGSKDSILSEDIDEAEMIKATTGEERQRNMEMAATVLVAAALENKEETGSENEDSDDDESGSISSNCDDEERAAKKESSKLPQKEEKISNALIHLNTEQNVTLKALVALLQDPDKGAPCPSAEVLKDVRIKKDAGALFSGAAIVKWLVENISGVTSVEDAQKLGQLLLESGEIFHSEGSRVFADAETLFYHARYGRSKKKAFSYEEIRSLLNTTITPNINTVMIRDQGDWVISEVTSDDQPPESVGDKDTANGDLHKDVELESRNETFHTGTELVVEDVKSAECEVETTDGIAREEWMKEEEEEEEKEEEEEEEDGKESRKEDDEEEIDSSKPNIDSQKRLPNIQTLESTENYPHPLHMAAAIGKSPGVIRELIMMFGVNKMDNHNRTPLMFAALGNNKESSCRTLINCSADVDLQDTSGLTALHVACYHGSKSAASVLLSSGASIGISDNMNHTALHWSMVPDNPSCLQLLTRYTMSPDLLNHTDANGLTPIHWSIFYNHPQHLNTFLRRCNKRSQIELTKFDAEGRTFATYAITKQSPLCLQVLLGAEPSLLTLCDHNSISPLHYACIQDSPESLNVLLTYKAPKRSAIALDINSTDLRLRTPLHYAVACNRLDIAAILINRGAQNNVRDDEGKTVMEYALELPNEMSAVLKGEVFPSSETLLTGSSRSSSTRNSAQRSKVCSLL